MKKDLLGQSQSQMVLKDDARSNVTCYTFLRYLDEQPRIQLQLLTTTVLANRDYILNFAGIKQSLTK